MTTLMDKLGVDVPIIQAGMAGGITTPEMVVSVANAGALGTIGAGYMSDAALKKDIREIKQLTDKPFAVNLFAVNLEAFSDDIQPMQQFLNRYRKELEIDPGGNSIKVHDYLQEKVNVILEENIPIVSTAFGVLSYMLIDRLKANDVTLIGMATNLDEARQLKDAGYDAIVAQGTEAGGHRGTFDVDKYPNGCQTGLHVLVQELLEHIDLPVIAAGGIHTKSQVDALLEMGVSAVQLGTRFLVAEEAGTNTAYRRALIKAGTNDTSITKVFSGRPARAIRNRFIEEVENNGIRLQSFPVQNQMTKDIRSAGKEFAAADMQSLWAGQGVGAIEKEESVAAIVRSLDQTTVKS
ncbi:MAG TPA: nitronate monooxygenase [Lentibacillus sp.]|uniref:NAD(P)H-dependent flavin oxidoreductase n=1 Tax=Lentibacillus sp. TaxID=1925746 RepID=UPI002B4B4C1B|nr:nitronate monooxygenase [Lentibacillus sp.]HLR60841.1 nitronate monooxygenase [Lentibacillus sp.]